MLLVLCEMLESDLILKVFFKKGLTIDQICTITGIGKTTLYRIKKTGKMSKKSFIKLLMLEQFD